MNYQEFYMQIRLQKGFVNIIILLMIIIGFLLVRRSEAFSTSEQLTAHSSITTIPYQGRLADSAGNPISANVALKFRFYLTSIAGAVLWEEIQNVQIANGLFNVMLGRAVPIPQTIITNNETLWLGITIGADPEMLPRVQLGSVPYAILAQNVPDNSITASKLAPGVGNQFGG